jgi:hypothetical protein
LCRGKHYAYRKCEKTNVLIYSDELQYMPPQVDRNCLSHDIAIERAKNKLRQLVGSPNTQLVNEYASLVRKEFDAIEQFVYNNKTPPEEIEKLDEALKAKYGIDADVDLASYVSDKLHIIVEAGRELNVCPCCNGTKTHKIPAGSYEKEEMYSCETCNGTGRLA